MLTQDQLTNRNDFVAHVFAEIEHIEQTARVGSPRRASRYIDGGEWLIQPRFALACLLRRIRRPSHQPILAGVSVKRLGRLLTAYLRDATHQFGSCAAAVNIRRHFATSRVVRSFYPFSDRPMTIKMLISNPSGRDALQAEIENRRIVEEVGHLLAPRILFGDLNARTPFVVEEFVTGRIPHRRRDEILLTRRLLPSLQKHYTGFGTFGESVEACFGSDFCEKIEHASELISWDPQWRSRKQFLSAVRRVAGSGKQLTKSFCHGDLKIDHVAVADDGRVFLLDWAGGDVRPVAVDLAQLANSCRRKRIRLRGACERLLDRLSVTLGSRDLFSPAEQMFAGCLQQIVVEERWRARYLRQGSEFTCGLKRVFDNANESLVRAHGAAATFLRRAC